MIVTAPAKLNLCLYVGPRRDDGLHELASLFEPLELADQLELSDSGGPDDEVSIEGVEQPDLVARALAALRERGWKRGPLRVEGRKRIPIAGGLGGGSADAAAILRLARGEVEGLRELAAGIGADVPSQIDPRPCLVGGAGEVMEPIPPPGEHALVLVPMEVGLSTAEVYAEADRLGTTRGSAEIESLRRALREAVASGASPQRYLAHLVNDLEPAALSLRPELEGTLEALREEGAQRALLTGSGPTAFGLFAERGAAETAAEALRGRRSPPPRCRGPWSGERPPVRSPLAALGSGGGGCGRLPAVQERPPQRQPGEADQGRVQGPGQLDLPAGRRPRLPGDGGLRRPGGPR
jgi:4-diphosphocytidyl-2-C-methyl-D-erythritol kinase